MKDLDRNVLLELGTVGETVTADKDGATVDLRGFNSFAATVINGTITGGGSLLPVLEHSDNGSTWVAVPAALVNGAFASTAVAATQRVGYVGTKRYVRVRLDVTGTYSAVTSILYAKGHPTVAEV